METAAQIDDISLEHGDGGVVTGAFGRCIACDAYQWLAFAASAQGIQVWCPTCNQGGDTAPHAADVRIPAR